MELDDFCGILFDMDGHDVDPASYSLAGDFIPIVGMKG